MADLKPKAKTDVVQIVETLAVVALAIACLFALDWPTVIDKITQVTPAQWLVAATGAAGVVTAVRNALRGKAWEPAVADDEDRPRRDSGSTFTFVLSVIAFIGGTTILAVALVR